MAPRSPQLDRRIEDAIIFMVNVFKNSAKRRKPVILHSLRVAFDLMKRGYSEKIVIGAILHDILEDSDVRLSEIEQRFGREIAALVSACSMDRQIIDRDEQYRDAFKRAYEYGKDALIIRAADLLDNSFYIEFVEELSIQKWLIKKMKFFLDISRDKIGKEQIYEDLHNRYFAELNRLKINSQ